MTGPANKKRVLNFHGIGAPERPLEPGEADYWIATERFRSVLDRIACRPDRDRFLITFDDGNLSDLTIGVPELRRHGLTAEFFVLTDRIGKPGSLAKDDIRSLISAGMRIGSHGVLHRDWASLPAAELDEELKSSRATLEAVCGEPVRSAAIPFGRYNAAVLAALRRAGYTAAYSSDGGSMDMSAFLRPRTSVRRDTDDADIDRILNGQMTIWKRWRRSAAMTIKAWV
jgi:peptidoglycan/xylan/chitin deacetylase (PgdA/CDA1 family)